MKFIQSKLTEKLFIVYLKSVIAKARDYKHILKIFSSKILLISGAGIFLA